MGDDAWERQAKNLIRAELMRRGMSQESLLAELAHHGVIETLANFRKKLSRGRFSAVFFLQVMAALGVDWIQLPPAPGTPEGDEAAGEHGAQRLARGDRHARNARGGGRH
ncbi:DUF6471 domain-containing protein [Sphingomonas sp. 28-62-11]|uniref:DUF6471 domain-containing protein n=1 Tax=Sphingomonas sp. 28-62-11 TaxID=1970432 RepID=UPI0035A8E4EE